MGYLLKVITLCSVLFFMGCNSSQHQEPSAAKDGNSMPEWILATHASGMVVGEADTYESAFKTAILKLRAQQYINVKNEYRRDCINTQCNHETNSIQMTGNFSIGDAEKRYEVLKRWKDNRQNIVYVLIKKKEM